MAESVLIFRIGSLGDTLVAVPAIRSVRENFPGARITMLCDRQVGRRLVLASELMRGSGFVDDFMHYPFDPRPVGRLLRPLRMAALLARLRLRRFDAIVYTAPADRAGADIERDRRFFRLAGIPRFIGFHDVVPHPGARPAGGYPEFPREADLLLSRLAADGMSVPSPGHADVRLPLSDDDRREVDRWVAGLPPDGGRTWIGVGIGGKKPVAVWPVERFDRVVQELIARHDVWPIVFGGPEDAAPGRRLVESWGRGWLAAGSISLKGAIAAMARTALYVGNDTGTMHMAAAAGIPCVAVFASAQPPGQWHPYGEGHRILRTPIDCEICRLVTCVDRRMECILAITPERVVEACEDVLAVRIPRRRLVP